MINFHTSNNVVVFLSGIMAYIRKFLSKVLGPSNSEGSIFLNILMSLRKVLNAVYSKQIYNVIG